MGVVVRAWAGVMWEGKEVGGGGGGGGGGAEGSKLQSSVVLHRDHILRITS